MRIFGDAALPPVEQVFYDLSSHILLPLCLIAIVAAVTVVLIVLLRKKKKKEGDRK